MLLTRVFYWAGSPCTILIRTYAKAATTSTAAGTGIQSLGKAAGKALKGGLKPGAKAAPVLEKKVLSVETDPVRLVTHLCGSNLMKEGGEDVKLKNDEEYPDWLWKLRTGPPPPIEEFEPDSDEYWQRVRKLALRRQNSLRHLNKYPKVT